MDVVYWPNPFSVPVCIGTMPPLETSGEAMRRRDFIKVIGGGTVAWPLVARAEQPRKIPRLCFLTFDPSSTLQSNRFDFFEGLRELGYVDGQTITIDYLSANGHGERFPALAAECLRRKADIIAVSTTPGAQAAKNATRTIPIVMIALGDPVGAGLVDSLDRPAKKPLLTFINLHTHSRETLR